MPQWVDEASTTWGENSAQYQVRVLGQFPKEADDTLIPLTSIEAATSRGSDPRLAHRTAPIKIGVDVARFGTDRTVLCVRQGNRVKDLDQY